MQFLPSTWKAYGMGGDINDPHDAIFGAANYLKANGGAAGRMDNALFRYNNSNRYVRAVTLYAKQIEADPVAYRAYHQWQVYYITPCGRSVAGRGLRQLAVDVPLGPDGFERSSLFGLTRNRRGIPRRDVPGNPVVAAPRR